MNVTDIKELAFAAQALGLNQSETGVKIMKLINQRIEAMSCGEEIRALQVSSDIKQANLNLLANEVLEFFSGGFRSHNATLDLISLAKSLIQEEQSTDEAAYNQCGDQGTAPVDPIAQVVENLKHARAEVFRLSDLRTQTSNADDEVAEAHKEACRAASAFQEELIKAIDASIK